MYALIIKDRLPSANEYIDAQRRNRFAGAKLKKDSQAIVEAAIRVQLAGVRIKGPVRIDYSFYEPNAKRDIDNVFSFAAKVVQDALVSMGVLENDSQKHVKAFSAKFKVDKEYPHIVVMITEVSNNE